MIVEICAFLSKSAETSHLSNINGNIIFVRVKRKSQEIFKIFNITIINESHVCAFKEKTRVKFCNDCLEYRRNKNVELLNLKLPTLIFVIKKE